MPAMAAGICAMAAAWRYTSFLSERQRLWGRMDHDRHTHYLAGLRLGLDLRHRPLLATLADVPRLSTWPPLRACLVATTFVAGANYRLAVLPNLAAWGARVLPLFVVLRLAAPCGGTLAGAMAAFWMLTCPAHRAITCNCMSESLAAMLTLLVMYAYLAAPSRGQCMSRMLAVSLTLLFYAKHTYWLPALAAVACCEGVRQRAELYGQDRAVNLAAFGWRLVEEWRRPLSWLVATLAALCVVSWACGTQPKMVWGGLCLGSMNQNLWHFAFLALVARVAFHWCEEGGRAWAECPPGWHGFALWHLIPSAVWFLLAKRVGYFVWFLGLENGANSERDVCAGLGYDWGCVHNDWLTARLRRAGPFIFQILPITSRCQSCWRAKWHPSVQVCLDEVRCTMSLWEPVSPSSTAQGRAAPVQS